MYIKPKWHCMMKVTFETSVLKFLRTTEVGINLKRQND